MKEISRCLKEFRFSELFTQYLLWDSFRANHVIEVNGQFFEVEGVAEKRGLVAFVCKPSPNQPFPGSAERKRIGREIAKLYHQHLIIFVDREETRQVWAVPKREEGKTRGTSEISFFKGKGVEHLSGRVQKLSFSLEESENTTLPNVVARVNQALLAEKVTKKFFKEFSDQRKAFVKFLDWIEDESKRDWYCSVLLNRLMFIYFLGGKGFLPGGTAFLTNGLATNTKDNGADTFYTHFLLPLSFFGLGEKQGKRGKFEDQFKDVLYLNGGLFAVHSVERELGIDKAAVLDAKFDAKTKIPDAEFQKWFDYFDKWRWTLDEDKVENEGYISPHILGYIFEKYINQKQMGAYYTKEDITGYICRNTIIPRLFDMLAETGDSGKKSVRPLPIGPHPNLLNDGRGISDGEGIDRYVYPSVKQETKLPTETDYEQEQRRKRYEGILEDFDAENIQGIDDFITYNLDIEKLALDFVSNIQEPAVLHAFYFNGLQQITVLDPTCGSGAFLFEALNILYPLYNACLSRMRYLVGKHTGTEPDIVNWGGRLHFDDLDADGGTFVDFTSVAGGDIILDQLRNEVERINHHPSAEYFIKKSIIVNNLFGVDIMEEAVEICKLRLFLTLIASVERDDSKDNFGVEPLPDIDFNILAGNTLVGYTSIADIDRLWQEVELGSSTLAFEKDHSKLRALVEEYGRVLKAWRLQQLGERTGAPISKEQVLKAAESVRPDLDEDLWKLYRTAGLATKQVKAANGKTKTVELTQGEFVRTHEPFHWLLEFPAIEATGGFDIIVGNPPWKEYSEVKKDYQVAAYETLGCGNLYALCTERSTSLRRHSGRFSFIVQLPLVGSARMERLRRHLVKSSDSLYVVAFDDRPGRLFENLEHCRSVIFITQQGSVGNIFASRYQRWYSESRTHLMALLAFHQLTSFEELLPMGFPKLSPEALELFEHILEQGHPRLNTRLIRASADFVFYQESSQYWLKATIGVPYYAKNGVISAPAHGRRVCLPTPEETSCAYAILMSSWFYLCFQALGDCFHVNQSLVEWLPVPDSVWTDGELKTLGQDLDSTLRKTAAKKAIATRDGNRIEYDEFAVAQSKPLIDRIDTLLARHFGMSDPQLDTLLNYDRKFRMGQSDDEAGQPGCQQ